MKTLKRRLIDFVYNLWINKGWYIVSGLSVGALMFWIIYPYVIVYMYDFHKQWLELSAEIAFLAVSGILFILAILAMGVYVVFIDPRVGKTKFKRK